MYCQNCGAKNEDNATSCVYCGKQLANWRPESEPKREEPLSPPPAQQSAQSPPPYQQPQQNYNNYSQRPVYVPVENVPDYLVFSILVTFFCCLIGGIIALVYSSQVKTKVAQGDMMGAWASSRLALGWCWASAISWFLLFIIMFMLNVAAGLFTGSFAG